MKEIGKELSRQFFDTVNQFNKFDHASRNFGTDVILSLSEIHLIDFIGDHYGCCANDAAEGLGITKGAVSQTLKSLLKLNFIERKPDKNNKSRFLLFLTDKGKTAYTEHKKYHENIESKITAILSNFTNDDCDKTLYFLKELENIFRNA